MNKIKNIKNHLIKDAWFWILSFISISLVIAGFCCPPPGEIHNSVLVAIGELFAWGVLGTIIKAIDTGASTELKKGDISLSVKGSQEKKED